MLLEIDGLEDQLVLSRAQGGLVVRPPLPAVAFGGRRIAWVYTRTDSFSNIWSVKEGRLQK